MAKNAKEMTAQQKGRTTKLSKKTVTELIEIILRKDKTESNQATQIKNLKAENNAVRRDLEGTEKVTRKFKEDIIQLKDSLKTKDEIIASKTEEINHIKEQFSIICGHNVSINKEIKLYKKLCVAFIIAVMILSLGYIL